MHNSIVMGVDVGGSHITAALVDMVERRVLKESCTRVSIDSQGDAASIISAWAGAIKEACVPSKIDVARVGIGMPGPFDYETGISLIKEQGKYDSLYGLNVKNLLSAELGIRADRIRLINDAACFLQGEAFGGAGKGYSTLLGLTLGTGLGSSVYRDQLAVDADLWRSPFREGIAEDYLSTRWFVRRYFDLSGKVIQGVKCLSLIAGTDELAREVFFEFGNNLGAFLNTFIKREEPEAIILGGNISLSFDQFEAPLRCSIQECYKTIPIHPGTLGEQSALLGASSLWYFPSDFENLKNLTTS